jgi:hypothetical protein
LKNFKVAASSEMQDIAHDMMDKLKKKLDNLAEVKFYETPGVMIYTGKELKIGLDDKNKETEAFFCSRSIYQ